MIYPVFIEEQKHIEELCAQNNVKWVRDIHECCKNETMPDIDGNESYVMAADPVRREIWLLDINSELSYFAALHELGHILDDRAYSLFERNITKHYEPIKDTLNMEVYAWEWASKHSRLEGIEKYADYFLADYYNSYIAFISDKELVRLDPYFDKFRK